MSVKELYVNKREKKEKINMKKSSKTCEQHSTTFQRIDQIDLIRIKFG